MINFSKNFLSKPQFSESISSDAIRAVIYEAFEVKNSISESELIEKLLEQGFVVIPEKIATLLKEIVQEDHLVCHYEDRQKHYSFGADSHEALYMCLEKNNECIEICMDDKNVFFFERKKDSQDIHKLHPFFKNKAVTAYFYQLLNQKIKEGYREAISFLPPAPAKTAA
ncbi:MAG: hypothetical protein H7Y04_16125 [Verrucomicrobia bacterium]|nr:hypothetical protein [Cytophagales bacterium]